MLRAEAGGTARCANCTAETTRGSPMPKRNLRTTARTRGPVFVIVFTAVIVLSLVSLAVALYLASLPQPTNSQQQLIETCSTCWKLGFCAIVGMIGGRTR